VHIYDLPTPAVVIDVAALHKNIATMADIHPGRRLRPHVKAHKCTGLAAEQQGAGHRSFTCATPREILGMIAAEVGDDFLLANETLDPLRLAALAAAQDDALITVAIDSEETLVAADKAGIRNVMIDVNVGLPRCGCSLSMAGRLADAARVRGINVRGVMGYEGHLMMVTDREEKRTRVQQAMALLAEAHDDVGGDIVSAGGTGTYDMFSGTTVNEVQAGSYALMDSHYAQLDSPFVQAMWVVGTVISVHDKWSVADVGLKSLSLDHGDPTIEKHSVWFCSDEHTTFAPLDGEPRPKISDRVFVTPSHIDPTMAMHDVAYVANQFGEIIAEWPIDLRGW
jgi:D-serine deaminase-like pyridoxal phosphate-dependent protein